MPSPLRFRAPVLCLVLSLALAACGGGSGVDDPTPANTGQPPGPGTTPPPPGGTSTVNPGPQVALLISNGHSPLLPNYMIAATGPQLAGAIQAAGFTVRTTYFTDDGVSYQMFVSKLAQIRDDWINGVDIPTRIVVVGHSHGCVRSHAALRAVPDCPIEQLVDLDGSSVGWTLVTHGAENALIGGAPEGAYNLGVQRTCAGVTSAGGPHDLEDVVFAHVKKGYEVRSGDVIVNPQNLLQLIEYDERWNVRPDGSATNLTCVFSGTLHGEVAAPGVTLGGVQAWIVTQLTTP